MSTEMVPFGKHKGKPVDALLDDRPYLDWLLSQPWAKEKLGNIYNIVINNGTEPTETPEHNAMQIKFLSEEYRLKFAVATHGARFLEVCTNEAIRNAVAKVRTAQENKKTQFLSEHGAKYAEWMRKWQEESMGIAISRPSKPSIEFKAVSITAKAWIGQGLVNATSPMFEGDKGVDVAFQVFSGWEVDGTKCNVRYVNGYSDCELKREDADGLTIYSDMHRAFSIELKPSVGDDYPAILRQMKRSESKYLLIRTYTGIGATEAQFREFFKSQGITVVFEHEVESAVLPVFDREIE